MGEVARATLDAGGHVTGIIPTFLTEREHMLKDVNDLIVTRDMHERKQLMFDHSAAFVALPAASAHWKKLVEQLTWSQLGRHAKPVILANIADFWSPFLNPSPICAMRPSSGQASKSASRSCRKPSKLSPLFYPHSNFHPRRQTTTPSSPNSKGMLAAPSASTVAGPAGRRNPIPSPAQGEA